jgi:PIN domain nuclease of toxin-antitoxin system
MPVSGEQALRAFRQSGYIFLPIQEDHVLALGSLPTFHRDPFDRMLVAQSVTETLHLITHDKLVAAYGGGIVLI